MAELGKIETETHNNGPVGNNNAFFIHMHVQGWYNAMYFHDKAMA